ncbi:MAG TPA: NFACT family protein [Pyrinomonadaceae bacterium]|nr:NFACT family protein [Pyrinomonadaceae bacterium]
MHQETLQQIVEEIGPLLEDHYLGKIFQLGPASLAIDFGLREGRYLLLAADPAAPRVHLIKRRLKDLKKQSIPHSQFSQVLRSRLSGARVTGLTRDTSERVIRLALEARDESGKTERYVLISQLTGRSANLFLLDSEGRITAVARVSKIPGQSIGDAYQSPTSGTGGKLNDPVLTKGVFESLSVALDSHYQSLDAERSFQLLANGLRSGVRKEIQQRTKLRKNLEEDLANHGEPQQHKRMGDLLLANISTAKRKGSRVLIKDFYTEGAPEIELEINKDIPLQEEAARYFDRYTKAKRAREEIGQRLGKIAKELEALAIRQARLEQLIEVRDKQALESFTKSASQPKAGSNRRAPAKIPGVRIYRSSDGYEILVGRGARDNDHLTFRVARPNDLWLHSADYPGSHVVVRREQRKEIPHRTVIEAAQLAARFSQASNDSKVVVHYTPRKFLSKPKGSAPGLVRMSSFKTILVEPKETLKRE